MVGAIMTVRDISLVDSEWAGKIERKLICYLELPGGGDLCKVSVSVE